MHLQITSRSAGLPLLRSAHLVHVFNTHSLTHTHTHTPFPVLEEADPGLAVLFLCPLSAASSSASFSARELRRLGPFALASAAPLVSLEKRCGGRRGRDGQMKSKAERRRKSRTACYHPNVTGYWVNHKSLVSPSPFQKVWFYFILSTLGDRGIIIRPF